MTIRKMLSGLLLMIPLAAQAVPVVTFDEGPVIQTGILQYDGAGSSLFGIDILFNTSAGDATPVNAGSGNALTCSGCLLNFQTGANIVEGPSIWQFGPGGSFNVSGTLFDGVTQIATGSLLDGVFTQTPTVVGGGGNALFASVGNVSTVAALTDYFGLISNLYNFANTELALQSCTTFNDPGGFRCELQNADLALTSRVPVPASMGLMGLGLLLLRRHLKA